MDNYIKLLKLKVFNINDIYNLIGNKNTAKSVVKRLQEKKLLKRVKHNLYIMCDIEYKKTLSNLYMIASKIKDDTYICYRSALDYYLNNNVYDIIYVSSTKRFNDFLYEGFKYKFINSKYDFGIITKRKYKDYK